jgi:uncharacterized protein (DUF952 family)
MQEPRAFPSTEKHGMTMNGKSMPKMVYKVCSIDEWAAALEAGVYVGSADDARDGFIHFSTAAQLPGTLARHFADREGRGREGLVLIALDAAELGTALKWEPARNGALFPHLYGTLDPSLARQRTPLEVGPDGRHILPGDLDRC